MCELGGLTGHGLHGRATLTVANLVLAALPLDVGLFDDGSESIGGVSLLAVGFFAGHLGRDDHFVGLVAGVGLGVGFVERDRVGAVCVLFDILFQKVPVCLQQRSQAGRKEDIGHLALLGLRVLRSVDNQLVLGLGLFDLFLLLLLGTLFLFLRILDLLHARDRKSVV